MSEAASIFDLQPEKESPNPEIDRALAKLMKGIKDMPPDTAVKVINAAINWEKVRHKIEDKDEEFDPDL
jgi:hypothetical protein